MEDEATSAARSGADRSISDFVDALNSFTTVPTGAFDNFLLGAVENVCNANACEVFRDADAPNVFDQNAAPSLFDVESLRTPLEDFGILMIGRYVTGLNDSLYKPSFSHCDDSDVAEWFTSNGKVVGNGLVVRELLGRPVSVKSDPDIKTVNDLMCSEGFDKTLVEYLKNGRLIAGIVPDSSEGTVNLPVKVLFLTIDAVYGAKGKRGNKEVADAASRAAKSCSKAQDYDSYNWLAGVQSHFAFPESRRAGGGDADLPRGKLYALVEDACTRSTPASYTISPTMNGPYGPSFGSEETVHTALIGDGMHKWLAQFRDQPHAYSSSRINGKALRNNDAHVANSGCVMEGARIMVAHGREVPIEDIAEGTAVYAAGGSPSYTTGELVKNPDVTVFYSINDDEPFMSLDHAILTQGGFKCPDPCAARAIDPNAPVSELKVGDFVNRAHYEEDGTIAYTLEEVKRINIARREGVMSYDLHFREGYRSYHANGYVCYLNYPDITLDSVTTKLEAAVGRDRALDIMAGLLEDDALRGALGSSAAAQVERAVSEERRGVVCARDRFIERDDAALRFGRIEFDDASARLSSGAEAVDFGCMAMRDGRVFLARPGSGGGLKSVAAVCRVQRDARTFFFDTSEDVANPCDGVGARGAFKVYHHGLMARGAVESNGVLRTFTAYNTDVFSLKHDDEEIGQLRIGHPVVDAEGRTAPTAELWLHDPLAEGGYRKVEGCSCAVGTRAFNTAAGLKTSRFAIDIALPSLSSLCLRMHEIQLPPCVHFTFDAMTEFAEEDERIGKANGMTAELVDDFSDASDCLSSRSLVAALRTRESGERALAYSLYAPVTPVMSDEDVAGFVGVIGQSVEELASLPVPESMGAIHELAYDALMDMASYLANDDELFLMGRNRPVAGRGSFSQDLVDLANAHSTFFKERFIPGYVCSNLSSSKEKTVDDAFDSIDQSRQRVEYFMRGDDDPSILGGSEEYATIMNALMRKYYAGSVPDLAGYLAAGDSWAKKLHAYAGSRELQMNVAVLDPIDVQEFGRPRHIANILDILDHSPNAGDADRRVSFGQDYLSEAFNVQIETIGKTFRAIDVSRLPDGSLDAMVDMLARAMASSAVHGVPFFGKELPPDLVEAIREEISILRSDASLLNAVRGEGELTDDRKDEELWVEWGSSLVRSILLSIEAADESLRSIAARCPKVGARGAFGLLGAALIVASCVNLSFCDFDDPEELIAFSTTAVETAVSLVDLGLMCHVASVMTDPGAPVEDIVEALANLRRMDVGYRTISANGGMGAEVLLRGGDTIGEELFAASRGFVKFTGFACAAVFCGLAIWDACEDWGSEGTAARVADVVNVIAAAGQVAMAVIDLSGCIALTASVAVPILGVLALVGAVCGLIKAYEPAAHVPTPAERFLSGAGEAFMKGLPYPTERYLEEAAAQQAAS